VFSGQEVNTSSPSRRRELAAWRSTWRCLTPQKPWGSKARRARSGWFRVRWPHGRSPGKRTRGTA